MKQATAIAIRSALTATLAELAKIEEFPQEGHWEHHRAATGGWSGQMVPKLSFLSLLRSPYFREDKSQIAEIKSALQRDYPNYLKLVGTPLTMSVIQPVGILMTLVQEAYDRFGTFELTNEQIETVVEDALTFFERETVRLRLYAPAIGPHGPADTPPMKFPGDVVLRPTTDQEFTDFYGGNPILQVRPGRLVFPDFVFVKEIEIRKAFGEHSPTQEDPVLKPFQEGLDRCIIALATFKDSGAVGYDGIWVTPAELTLGLFGRGHYFGNEHVPLSHYEISREEASQIEAHAKALEGIHSTLEMASQRLVDSTRRIKARDALVDAVIGLEGILLANIGERTELRFRFALHYALLSLSKDRKSAFNTARDLYDVRSTIAHGSAIDREVKVGGKTMPLTEAATLARSILRQTISIFAPNGKHPDFMKSDYWISKALSL